MLQFTSGKRLEISLIELLDYFQISSANLLANYKIPSFEKDRTVLFELFMESKTSRDCQFGSSKFLFYHKRTTSGKEHSSWEGA